jgi:hypothetical protein
MEENDPTAVPGTVIAPTELDVAAVGASIDVVVAAGGAAGTAFVFRVASATTMSWKKGGTLVARIHATRAALVTTTLSRPQRRALYRWHFRVKAGASIVRLHLPRQIRRPGYYWFTWVAQSGSDRVVRRIRVQLLSSGEKLGRVVTPAKQPVEVILAGDGIGNGVANDLSSNRVRVLESAGADAAFAAAAGDAARVAVVDVDQYGVRFVHDLHSVFPSLRIVALASRDDALAAARIAGASATLPSTAPDSAVARLVARLAR